MYHVIAYLLFASFTCFTHTQCIAEEPELDEILEEDDDGHQKTCTELLKKVQLILQTKLNSNDNKLSEKETSAINSIIRAINREVKELSQPQSKFDRKRKKRKHTRKKRVKQFYD